MSEVSWIWPVIVGDVLCDICIGEDDDSDSEDEGENGLEPTWTQVPTAEEPVDGARTPKYRDGKGNIVKLRKSGSERRVEETNGYFGDRGQNSGSTPEIELTDLKLMHASSGSFDRLSLSSEKEDKEEHIDSEQDCAIAGLVSMVVMYVICVKRWNRFLESGEASVLLTETINDDALLKTTTSRVLLWSAFEDLEWWLAAIGGLLLFCHYLTLLWAYDKAPSTVINPLIQVSSVWVLLGSAVPSTLLGNTFIRPFDLFCYVLIIIGGLLPSLEGDIKQMLKLKFWLQAYVRNIVLSEIALGLYDLVVSYSLQTSSRKLKFQDLDAAALEDEFFFVAWCWFVIVFAFSFACHPRLNSKMNALQFNIPLKVLLWSSVGQLLTMLGYYVSAFAYAWYYQASIVHAAETSLQQALNLGFAYVLRRMFNLGRASAIKGMRYKVVSCITVTIGLFLVALQDEEKVEDLHDYSGPGATFANHSRILLGHVFHGGKEHVQLSHHMCLRFPPV